MKYELIVVGGGFGGVGAAIAAARNGVKTLLIEKTNSLGEAAGTAISVAKSNGTDVKNVDIKEVQNILLKNGAILH